MKVDKGKFQNLSRLKNRQWKELQAEFAKFAEKHGMKTELRMKGKKKDSCVTDMLNVMKGNI